MTDLKLISVDILHNYVEPNDKFFVTAKWQNCGERPNFDAKVVVDLVFCGRHRRDTTLVDNFRFAWTPSPNTYLWEKGDIWTTTGAWIVPSTWGGSFNLRLSLINDRGESIEFIGKDSKKTTSQEITEVEIAWGYGRKRMLEQRKSLHIDINAQENFELLDNTIQAVEVNPLKFNTKYPSVCGYKDIKWNDFPTVLTVRRISDNSNYIFVGEDKTTYQLYGTENGVKYSVNNEFCNFDVLIYIKEDHLEILLDNISQKTDYELISFEMPSLVRLSTNDVVFTNFYNGGRITKLEETLTQNASFYFDDCNAIGVSSNQVSFCINAEDVDNILHQSVIQNYCGEKSVCLGATIRKHIPANKEGLASIPVGLKPLELWYSDGYNWKFAADTIKNRLNNIKSPQIYNYKNTLMYKILLDATGQYADNDPAKQKYARIITLKQAKEIIMSIYNLSNGMRQVVYLTGWQKYGHDFSYPYAQNFGFNSKCGTIEEFNQIREELKAYNVNLSLHDNIDDAYLSDDYDLDENIVCLDETGHWWKGWLWAGGLSYIVNSQQFYKQGEIANKINKIVKDYGIEGSYHFDVLSSEVRRYDFNPIHPMSGQDSINGKIDIINEFNKNGIDITSEILSIPFIDKLGYAQACRSNYKGSLFYNDSPVPLTTIALHGIIPYKVSNYGTVQSLLCSLAYGGSCAIEVEDIIDPIINSQSLYFSSIPMSNFTYERITNAVINGNEWIIEYENGKVTVNIEEETYCIEYDGKIISNDFITFMQLNENEYCYFSKYAGKAEIELPNEWNKALIIEKNENGIASTNEIVKKNGFSFAAKANVPYIIKRGV